MSNECRPWRRARGLTLVELIVFIMIIGIALTALLSVMSYTTRNSADPLRRKQALMIAESLLEEVQLARFSYCQPGAANFDTATSSADCSGGLAEGWGPNGGTRPFLNINDYVAAANQATAAFDVGGQLADASGNPMPVTGYTARLTITPQALGGIAASGTGADVNVLRIRVEVSYAGETITLDGFRTRYAPNFQ
jgi:MSHA pilin protein MshD